ncbi:MAG: hypothetical protein JNJ40_18430 [Bacteroidia bacterium]|nr:hypothetical protein [Bacteroidia bacterium]
MINFKIKYSNLLFLIKFFLNVILWHSCIAQAQTANVNLFKEENSHLIEWPYQLTFIHELPKNKVDSVLIQLLKYAYHEEIGLVKYKLLEEIAATKTHEAFYLLYAGCVTKLRSDNYFPPFQQLCYTIKNNGGLQLLNNYFLNGSVEESGSEKNFEEEVVSKCKKMKPVIHYYLNMPQEIDPESITQDIQQFRVQNKPCKKPELLTKKNLKKVKQIYELTFLHEQPVNTVDSCVRFLMDSIDWRVKKNWHLVYDSIWNRIAQTRSTEAFQLLYLSSWDEVSPYNEYLYSLTNWVYSRVDNYLYTYFYQGKKLNIDSIGQFKFRTKVLFDINKRAPQIYICDEPSPQEVYVKKTKSPELKSIDRQIIRIIKRNSRLTVKHSPKNLENKIRQLPFVQEVKFGDCYEVLDIETTFNYVRIYTSLVVGEKLVERTYSIKNRALLFIGIRLNYFPVGKIVRYHTKKWRYASAYSFPTLKAVKEYCENKKNKNEK